MNQRVRAVQERRRSNAAVTQEINEQVRDIAGELAYEFGSRMPGHRFVNVDGTPQNAQVKVTPSELEALLRVAIEVGMELEREGTT